jgi:eukaryotic-like serine/threonine-protein kinase
MGVVYRALDPVLKRRVAIKVMSDAFAQNDDLRERFLREAQAAGSLQHPNVITIYDFGEVDGHLYIAMEFVEGQDVAELLAHQVPLTLANKLDIAIGVLQGLAFAHKRGIVHRDVKPANIRVDADGNARIMDFGVAHLASSEMTRTGVMVGTPSYMAPEQIVGGKVGPETDLFSVGAVLYEMLTGTRPFAGGPLQAVMYRVLSETPMPLETAAPGLPARLNEIVMHALAKEPEKRYTSALAMANDLLAVRASLDAGASSPGTLSLRHTIESALDERRTSQFKAMRRRRVALSGAGVATATVLVLSGWLIARRSIATQEPTAAASLAGSAESLPTQPPVAVTSASAPSPDSGSSARQHQADRPQPVQSDKRAPSSRPVPNGQRTAEQPSSTKVPRASVSPPASEVAPRGATQPTVSSSPAGAAASPNSVTVSIPPPIAPPANTAPANTTVVRPNPPAPTTPSAGATGATSTAAAPANPTSASASSANAGTEIANVIDAYARAIESRDMGQLRRVYSMITSDQASAFSDFFSSTRTLRAVLAVKNLQVDGNHATAHVAGTYEFTTTAGRAQQQAATFQVELRREGGVWKLIAVR